METAYAAAADLETTLGDPFDPNSRVAFATSVARDDAEEFPSEAVGALRAWGFHRWFAPKRWGGRLGSYEELLAVTRCVARRDLTVAIAHGTTLLGSNPIWIWGTDEQRGDLAALVNGGDLGAFGLSEADHGSDILSCELRATRTPDGYELNGEKWPIGNATRGTFVTVFARTAPEGGARGFSLFFVDKRKLAEGGFSPLPKIRTLGGRGHDLSGIRFQGARVPPSSLIGRPGLGLDQSLKVLQLTRTLITGLSLGAGDTALRIALRWARERRLYGHAILNIPPVRELLVGAFVDLLICDCVAIPIARAISMAPDRLSLWSSVAKYFVPVTVENVFRDTAIVLGARQYLREGLAAGMFQKMMRDHSIASVFEGTTFVNLHLIATQLPAVVENEAESGTTDLLEELFDLSRAAPNWDPPTSSLKLHNGGRDEIAQGLPAAIDRARQIQAPLELERLLHSLNQEWQAIRGAVRAILQRQRTLTETTDGFELARRFCKLEAAACCVHYWVASANRTAGGGFVTAGSWLVLALQRLLGLPSSSELVPGLVEELIRRGEEQRAFSLIDIPLGR
jgi:alkylation response protein AidB-like acyl-CoA dehydrogenase